MRNFQFETYDEALQHEKTCTGIEMNKTSPSPVEQAISEQLKKKDINKIVMKIPADKRRASIEAAEDLVDRRRASIEQTELTNQMKNEINTLRERIDGIADHDSIQNLIPKNDNNGSNQVADKANEETEKKESRTTILEPGIVESRNLSNKSQISEEIQSFINGTDDNNATLSPQSEFRTFFTIWMFITRLPSPSWVDLHPGFLMRGMSYFPVVGSILGCMYAVIFDCLDISIGLSATVSAALSISVGLYITGCFHEDGLADSADGLGGGWSKSQVLKIMVDSRVGTFGCAVLSLFLFTKLQLLGTLGISNWVLDFQDGGSSGTGPAIIVAQMISRLSAPYLIRTRDYVAEVGPKSPFYRFMVEAKHIVSWPRVLFASMYCFILSSMLYGQLFSIVLILAVLSMAHLCGNKGDYLLGGVMGDFLGGTICICEIVVLVLIATRYHIMDTIQVAVGIFESSAPDDLQSMAVELYASDRLRPIFHISCIMCALKVWCSFVGPPDMYDREANKKESEEKAD